MKTNFNFENHKVGDKVYHVISEWLEVTDKNGECIQLKNEYWYKFNGKINDSDIKPAIYPYNPFENNQERVVEVLTYLSGWQKKKMIKILEDGRILCWNTSECKETCSYENWREIEPQKELTQEEKINILWEKYGKEI